MTGPDLVTAGMKSTFLFEYEAGAAGLETGARVRIGVPNTGWEPPVVPQQRYWDELVSGSDRRLAPFHPVNTTAVTVGGSISSVVLDVMERMLVPDEDPALAYWRWWVTATLETGSLQPGDLIRITYGDTRFGSPGVQVQTFPEDRINVVAFVQPSRAEPFVQVSGSPVYFHVKGGPPVRANVVVPSTYDGGPVPVSISITDQCHCIPDNGSRGALEMAGVPVDLAPGKALRVSVESLSKWQVRETATGRVWGSANPITTKGSDGLHLFWGDLHAQSEHHVMHSQKKDFRQQGWSKGISCGTLDECYQYAREVSCLDFVAMTDQGACLTDAWEFCQGKVREYHDSGRFVTFKGYEAGAPSGHRNVIYSSDAVESPLDRAKFSNFHPPVLYEYYRDRGDALLIPHHVKTWTDWQYHDPELEPIMEIYSCWGQSETPGIHMWNKGMTPGAGAWAAYERGYQMGMMASSDNHVGMPGRSSPGDRQGHTPFKGGLCAVWSPELTREALFSALRNRQCYGTTGARIIVRFAVNGAPMGSTIHVQESKLSLFVEIHGTDEIRKVELVTLREPDRQLLQGKGEDRFIQNVTVPFIAPGLCYLRVTQADGECAWASPIFIEVSR